MDGDAGNKIRALRDGRGLSLRELARRTGIDFSTLNRLERGTQPLDVVRMRKIGQVLDVKPSQLLADDDVAIRSDEIGVQLVRELEKIPDADRVPVLAMARELVRVARHIAAQWAGEPLAGDPDQVMQLSKLWNGLDDPHRARALRTLRASLSD